MAKKAKDDFGFSSVSGILPEIKQDLPQVRVLACTAWRYQPTSIVLETCACTIPVPGTRTQMNEHKLKVRYSRSRSIQHWLFLSTRRTELFHVHSCASITFLTFFKSIPYPIIIHLHNQTKIFFSGARDRLETQEAFMSHVQNV